MANASGHESMTKSATELDLMQEVARLEHCLAFERQKGARLAGLLRVKHIPVANLELVAGTLAALTSASAPTDELTLTARELMDLLAVLASDTAGHLEQQHPGIPSLSPDTWVELLRHRAHDVRSNTSTPGRQLLAVMKLVESGATPLTADSIFEV